MKPSFIFPTFEFAEKLHALMSGIVIQEIVTSTLEEISNDGDDILQNTCQLIYKKAVLPMSEKKCNNSSAFTVTGKCITTANIFSNNTATISAATAV